MSTSAVAMLKLLRKRHLSSSKKYLTTEMYICTYVRNYVHKHLATCIIDVVHVCTWTKIAIQWNLSIKDTLNKGHLSIKDTVCSPNHIELCTNLFLN